MTQRKLLNVSILSLALITLGACNAAQPEPPAPSAQPSASSSMPTPTTEPTANAGTTPLKTMGYGTSYGMCFGYCNHQLILTETTMRLTHTAHQASEEYPEKVLEKPMSAERWQNLTALADFDTLSALPERVGCPDCADGGAEWITLSEADASYQVTFEPAKGLPRQAELLKSLRAIYQEMAEELPAF